VAETPDTETQGDTQPETAQQRASSRVPAILVSLSALAIVGAATANFLPNFSLPDFNRLSLPHFSSPNFNRLSWPDFSWPDFNRFAPSPHETASAPIPDPTVNALKDIQLSQQQNAAVLVALSQSSETQQADLKRISRQLSLVTAQLSSVQNAMTPLTTSSIPQTPLTASSIPHPSIRARVVGTSRKIIPPLPKPVGTVSVGGAPLSPAPAPGSRAG
jgi:hypothetical protein